MNTLKGMILYILEACRCFVFSKVFQPILYLLFGPRRFDSAPGTVQSYEILADNQSFYAFKHTMGSFLLRFRGLKDVTYIDRGDVTLYTVTEEEFVFVRTRPGVDIYDVEQHPFLYDIQHSSAEELITAPHCTVFQHLKGKLARDGSNIAYLHNCGRCGSTLVATMMHKTKQCVVQSEPTAVINLAWMINEKDYPPSRKSVEYLEIVRATFLLICPDANKLYFIKPWGTHTLSLLPLLNQALPGIKELFMYRSIRPIGLSFKKMFHKLNFQRLGKTAVSLIPINYRVIWDKLKCKHGEKSFFFVVLCQIHAYMTETQDRDDIKAYCYESLMENKEAFTLSLLQEVGIGVEYLEDALSALKRDSQANSDLTCRKTLSKEHNVTISSDVMEWVVRVAFNEFGIQLEGEEGRVNNIFK